MKSFSVYDRQKYLSQMEEIEFDLFIIGGGVNGAGIARDAAMRGMKVGLVEASDFASGTSSRSSKLIHGGIRYLENMEFKLVFEALSERQKLFEIAPHLSHPLRFMIPIYKSSRVGMTMMGLGMWLYDALSLFQAPEMHERLNKFETQERMPLLQQKNLVGSYVYSDAYMDDDRLVLETLRSANEYGALSVNYTKAVDAELDSDGRVKILICEDLKAKKKFKVKARHFVSSVGPWTDILASDFFDNWKKILRPTKGVHLTFKKDRLPLPGAVVMGAESRIVFGIPRHEMVIIGTTDTDFSGDPSSVKTEKEDVRYLLSVIDQYFPEARIKEEDILASYAGVRPLVQDQSQSEGKTSREHTIFTDQHGVTFVAGGKYTTYRLMSEQVVEECLKYFSIEDQVRFKHSNTQLPLNPQISLESLSQFPQLMDEVLQQTKLTSHQARLLVERHGLESLEIVKKYRNSKYWELEAYHAIENTMCFHLLDFYTRRTPLFLAEQDHGLSILDSIAEVFRSQLGWTEETLKQEMQSLRQTFLEELAWRHKNT